VSIVHSHNHKHEHKHEHTHKHEHKHKHPPTRSRTHAHVHTHIYTYTHTHTYTIAQKGEWVPEDSYDLKDEQHPDINFSGARGKSGTKFLGLANAEGGGIFKSLQFLRLEKFEMDVDECKVRAGGMRERADV